MADISESAPPDSESKTLRCTVASATPRYISPDESFAIWEAVRDKDELADLYRAELAADDGSITKQRVKEIERFIHNPRDSRVIIKGPLGRISAGEFLNCSGRWRHDSRYGWSFQVYDYNSVLPQDAAGVSAWLQTRVNGIGPVFAEAIVEHFGAKNVYKVLDADPTKLKEVKLASGRAPNKNQLETAIESWDDVKNIRQIETFLFGHGITAAKADQLYRRYGENVISILEENPYQVTEIKGIGFQNADKIAQSMGVEINDPNRIEAAILYTLQKAEEAGNVFLTLEQFLIDTGSNLRIENVDTIVPPPEIAQGAERLRNNEKIVVEKDEHVRQRIYLKYWWEIERDVAKMVRGMISDGHELLKKATRPTAPENATQEEIEALRLPTDRQWEAIETVSANRLTILSGLPGAGKCLHPESKVLVNGFYDTIENLWRGSAVEAISDGTGWWAKPKNDLTVVSINEQQQLCERKVSRLYCQEVKEVCRKVTLKNGKTIRMTKQHKLFSLDGWTNDFQVGDVVACPNTDQEHSGKLVATKPLENGKFTVGVSFNPIAKIEDFYYSGFVYDLEVEELHNYIAEGIITHNTATTNTLIKAAHAEDLKVLLAAPTGKAARRMREMTQHPASTIHRLLEYSAMEGGFMRDEDNPLDGDLLIVDESSMIQLDLFHDLLRAIPETMHVLLVGDPDQLPPVGAGKAFDDLIHSEVVPRVHLTEIFRQAAKSMIIQNARRLNQGEFPFLSHETAEQVLGQEMIEDFYWIPRDNVDDTLQMTVSAAVSRIPNAFNLDPKNDIMVLAPQRGGRCGLYVINAEMERLLNGVDGEYKKAIINKPPFKLDDQQFRTSIAVGSRIVQTKNMYHQEEHKSVMNGEVGIVLDYDEQDKQALLQFDDGDREFWLPAADMDSFQLAWALTIHRSQGSQWPCVVAPVSYSHYVMLSRNLEYVAVTRAEQLCVMIGESQALSVAVKNVELPKRNSTLINRILNPSESGELF